MSDKNKNDKEYISQMNAVCDVVPDTLIRMAENCSTINSSIKANLTAPAAVAKYATPVIAATEEGNNISSDMESFAPILVEAAKLAEESDVDFNDEDTSTDIFDKVEGEIVKKYYYKYEGDVKEVKEIPKEVLREFFDKNGAKKKKDNNDVYTFTIDGKEYSYNISTYQMSVEPDNKTLKKENMFVRFYMRDDATYEDITNTITICAGQGALDTDDGPFVEGKERLDEGVNTQKSSLVIIPYGLGDGTQGFKSSNKATMATRIGNFMVGGTNREITNSIVGYSLGGNAAYEALAQEENKGLYKVCVPVNTFMDQNFCSLEGDSIDNMIGTKIIQLEARKDNYRNGALRARRTLLKNGFPVEDLMLFTNEPDEYKYSEQALGDNFVFLDINLKTKVDGKDQDNPNYDPAWVTHFHGINMIKTSGILTYLGDL